MRIVCLILLLLPAAFAGAQDTVMMEERPNSGKLYRVVTAGDTLLVGTYKSGKLESVRPYRKFNPDGEYKRYYENGRLMWNKNMKGNREDGNCTYYDNKGSRVAELIFRDGLITDTVYLTTQAAVLLGRATHFSEVIGGADRGYFEKVVVEDEIREWPYMNHTFTMVKIAGMNSIPVKDRQFETDHNGDFFLVLSGGDYGFFPAGYDLNTLTPGQFCPPQHFGGSTRSGWNMQSPLHIEGSSIVSFHLHFSSIGYAP